MTRFIAWGQRVLPKAQAQPPGNSLAMIETAYAHGYDGVEIDLRITADGDLVLAHDDNVEKRMSGSGRISRMATAEVTALVLNEQAVPAGDGPHHPPTLAEALAANGGRGHVMVDLRRLDEVSERALERAIRAAGFDTRLLILLAYTRREGLRYREVWPEAITMLKAPASLAPPDLDARFVNGTAAIGGVLAQIAAWKDSVFAFRAAADREGCVLGIYMHRKGIDDLRELVRLGPDFITSMNPTDFDAVRAEFGLERGPRWG